MNFMTWSDMMNQMRDQNYMNSLQADFGRQQFEDQMSDYNYQREQMLANRPYEESMQAMQRAYGGPNWDAMYQERVMQEQASKQNLQDYQRGQLLRGMQENWGPQQHQAYNQGWNPLGNMPWQGWDQQMQGQQWQNQNPGAGQMGQRRWG